jgi:polyphenol oxidase
MALQKNIYKFDNLSQFNLLFHAVTTRMLPSMRKTASKIDYNSLQYILKELKISNKHLTLMDQIHSAHVIIVTQADGLLQKADGMIITRNMIYGGVITADCLPIILYDPKLHLVALVHAGYKGLLTNILLNTVNKLQALGSNVKDLFVGIGPGIGVCCYNVPKARFEKFFQLLPNYNNFFTISGSEIYLDLKQVANLQLTDTGIPRKNIEIAPYCTKSDNDLFFSYRAEGNNFGEFLTVAGLL